VAPRPGLEPGTYGLTVELTPISMAAKLKIRNVFFLRIRPSASDRAYPEPLALGQLLFGCENSNQIKEITSLFTDREPSRPAG
jgi:hypothetical protein